jgi:hypothetical protein
MFPLFWVWLGHRVFCKLSPVTINFTASEKTVLATHQFEHSSARNGRVNRLKFELEYDGTREMKPYDIRRIIVVSRFEIEQFGVHVGIGHGPIADRLGGFALLDPGPQTPIPTKRSASSQIPPRSDRYSRSVPCGKSNVSNPGLRKVKSGSL